MFKGHEILHQAMRLGGAKNASRLVHFGSLGVLGDAGGQVAAKMGERFDTQMGLTGLKASRHWEK